MTKKHCPSGRSLGFRLVGVRDVMQATGFCKDTLLSLANNGQFPSPLRAGRKLVWREADVQKWAETLPPAA